MNKGEKEKGKGQREKEKREKGKGKGEQGKGKGEKVKKWERGWGREKEKRAFKWPHARFVPVHQSSSSTTARVVRPVSPPHKALKASWLKPYTSLLYVKLLEYL